MGIMDWLLKSKRVETATFTVSTFYPNGSIQGGKLPRIEVQQEFMNEHIDPQKVYFLLALEVAQHSFFRLYGEEKQRAISLWHQAISSKFSKDMIVEVEGSRVATTTMQLFFSKRPYGTVTPKLEKSTYTPTRVVSDTALALFIEMRSKIQGELLVELDEAIEFGLDAWKYANPKSTESTWLWLAWIDYPGWVYDAIGSYSVSGRAIYEWTNYTSPDLGIKLIYPDMYRIVQQGGNELAKVVSFAREGKFFFRVYIDRIDRGERFKIAVNDWDAKYALLEIIEYWKKTFSGEGKKTSNIVSPREVKFGNYLGFQTELTMWEKSVEVGKTLEAVCKLNDEYIGGLYLWSPKGTHWMNRMVFEQIRSTLFFDH